MALPVGIFFGAVAAVGLPYALADAPEPWQGWSVAGSVDFALGDNALHFSWPIFCVVTLLVWGVLRAAQQP